MKKLLILIALFALALAVEAKRKAEPVLLDEEFNLGSSMKNLFKK